MRFVLAMQHKVEIPEFPKTIRNWEFAGIF
jgi:hypothetical protein